jgi:LysR family transcriptional regulator, regulator of abg operon
MKLHALQALVAAVEEGSLRGAARRIGLSQPALTKIVRELELELAAPLLDRTSRGVLPTAQGKVLYQHALKALRELGSAVDEINQLGGQMVGELTVGAVPVAVMLLVPEALRTFGREFPGVRLRLSEELFFAQLQRLRSGQVDIALTGVPEDLSTGEFVVEALMTTTMVIAVRKGSPYARCQSLADLAEARWVYTGSSSETSGYARLLLERHGLPPPPVGAIVNSTLALLSLVTAGDYVGLMPQQIMQHPLAQQVLVQVPVREGGLALQISAVVRRESAVSPVLRHFLAHLHRAAFHAQRGRG